MLDFSDRARTGISILTSAAGNHTTMISPKKNSSYDLSLSDIDFGVRGITQRRPYTQESRPIPRGILLKRLESVRVGKCQNPFLCKIGKRPI